MPRLPIEHIASDPGHAGGRPRIKGKGITVEFLVGYLDGSSPMEEICRVYDLTPGQVYAAWSYYYDHKEEMDEQIRKDDEAFEQIPAFWEQPRFKEFRARLEALEQQEPTPASSSEDV
jgi:uncharacterized protein (DUF433 family)